MGKIIIVSSHILPELADFCNTVGIIERGVMLALGPVHEVIKLGEISRNFDIKLLGPTDPAREFLLTQPHVAGVESNGDSTLRLMFNGDLEAQVMLLQTLVRNGFPVLDFREQQADLEDIFLRITTGAVQ